MKYSVEAALKMQQWERTKGELRAMVVMAGAYEGSRPGDPTYERFLDLKGRVEAFITDVQDDGLVG